MARKSTGLLLWLGIAVIVVLLDQVSKITMSRLLVYGQSEMITTKGRRSAFWPTQEAGSAGSSAAWLLWCRW
jgi:lipoprotein signal peptidase